MKLHNLIIIGMIVGVIAGLALWGTTPTPEEGGVDASPFHSGTIWILNLLGATIFTGGLKMIIAPLIFASIICGVTSLPKMGELGSIAWKTFAYYSATTVIAVTIGLGAVLLVQPGKTEASQTIRAKRVAELVSRRAEFTETTGKPARVDHEPTSEYRTWLVQKEGAESPDAGDRRYGTISQATDDDMAKILKGLVQKTLMNPFESLSSTNALGIILFAILMGLACSAVGAAAQPVVRFFQGLNEVIMKITLWFMAISPVAIGCIMAEQVAVNGPDVFKSLGAYCVTVIGGIAIHVVLLVTIARVLGGVGPLALWAGLREAMLISFTTKSSAATLPVTIENVTHKLGVSPKVANFSLPLGATMNMDGTALYEGVAVIFLIQIYGGLDDTVGIGLSFGTTLAIFITAVVASIGAAAVPSAGLVTMVLVADAVGLPFYYIPLIFAVDAFLDQFRTTTNVLGDSVGAIVVSRMEHGKLGDERPPPPPDVAETAEPPEQTKADAPADAPAGDQTARTDGASG